MRLLVTNGALLVLAVVAILGITVLDRSEASVEASVRRYAAAVTSGDLEAALAEVAPGQRDEWREWLGTQLGNVYEVRGIAVHSPSILDRLFRGVAVGPREVSVVLDINRGFEDEFYEPTTRVPVEQVDGRWYLSRPLLVH